MEGAKTNLTPYTSLVMALSIALLLFFSGCDDVKFLPSEGNGDGGAVQPSECEPCVLRDCNFDWVARFCPGDDCKGLLLERIEGADSNIFIQIYSFTLDDVAQKLVEKDKAGIEVKVLFDFGQSEGKYSVDEYLAGNGVEVKYDSRSGLQHNKVLLVDGRMACFGSYNYSSNATERNRENLFCVDNVNVVDAYSKDFEKNWEEVS